MSAPVISEVRVSPSQVPIGQQATVTVVASDPDARQVLAEATVVDAVGQLAKQRFAFAVSDPLIYTVTVDSGVVAQDPSDPAVFIWSP